MSFTGFLFALPAKPVGSRCQVFEKANRILHQSGIKPGMTLLHRKKPYRLFTLARQATWRFQNESKNVENTRI
jgi:hypothetical protein